MFETAGATGSLKGQLQPVRGRGTWLDTPLTPGTPVQ